MRYRRSSAMSARRSGARLAVLLAVCGFTGLVSLCQDLRTLRHQAWSTEEGLPQSSVHRILQSRDGYLWLATEGGLARFDGFAFQTFSHRNASAFLSDDVSSLAEDAAGTIWAGTADGLVRLQSGNTRRFGTAEGLPSASISGLVALANDGLLVLTPSGLALGEHQVFHPALGALPRIVAIEPARGGGAWLVAESEVFRYEKGAAKPSHRRLPEGFGRLTGLAEAANGDLWLTSTEEVVAITLRGVRRWKTGRELPGTRVESLTVDRNGIAWAGTDAGLSQLTAASAGVTRVPALDGTTVLSTIEDAEGNHWIGTDAAGLHVLRQLKFRSVAALAGLGLTAAVEASDGAIWVGTRDSGLRRVRADSNDSVDQPIPAARLTSPVILSLAPGANGSIWAGTPDGLNVIDATLAVREITSADGLPDDFIRSLLADPDGSVWAGTRRGLAHVRGTRIDVLTVADGLGGDLVGAMLRTTARASPGSAPAGLWIGTSGGLSWLRADGSFRTYTPREGLPSLIVTALAQDADGVLWVATRDGGFGLLAGDRFQPVQGLPVSSEISGMVADGNGFLWLRSAREIERVSIAALHGCVAASASPCRPGASRYGVADGVPSEEALPGASPALWRTASGEIWFTTRRGAGIVDAEHLALNTTPPPVSIQRFLIDEVPAALGPDTLQISPGHTRFTMEYAGLSYRVPSKVRYRFMLEGFEHDWTDAGSRRSATYTNLPPRLYRFRVQASNEDGVWSPAGAEFSFRITSPFYRRWWFYVLLLLVAAGLFAVGYQLRLRRLRSQFEAVLQERNRIAREIHDTLAQDFVGVSIQLDIITQLLGQAKVDAAAAQVASTRKLVIDGLAEARRSIWELRANTAHDSLPTRLSQLLERDKGGPLVLRLRVGGVFRPLAPELESEVLRIAQEALANVKRHAQATEATVQLRYSSDMLVLEVQDDGRGFDPAQSTALHTSQSPGHYGLQGMRERAAALHGVLEITSAPAAGTTVRLTVSIPPPERPSHAGSH